MMMWTVPAGAGATRYVVVAHLDASSSVALVAPEGFTVARWRTGPTAQLVRGQWISPMNDLRLVLKGDARPVDVRAEEQMVRDQCRAWGAPGSPVRCGTSDQAGPRGAHQSVA